MLLRAVRLFRKSARTSGKTAQSTVTNRFRPALEALDARVVPAGMNFEWTGDYSTDANDWRNWTDHDHAGPVGVGIVPTAGDNLYFGEWEGGGVNCIGLTGSFGTVTIDFPATVTFGGPVTAETFAMYSGAISQPTSGTDLTVEVDFFWSGGILNSSTNAATVRLSGATGTIDPGAGNTITTGSTLSLESRVTGEGTQGSTATFKPGELILAGGTGIEVDSLCRADVKPTHDAAVVIRAIDTSDAKTMKLKAGSMVSAYSGVWNGQNLKFLNEGGFAEFRQGSVASFGPNATAVQPTAYIKQTAGELRLYPGATLSAHPDLNGYTELTGGTLAIAGDPIEPGLQDPAELIGDLKFTGGMIGFLNSLWTFKVTGNVTWSGGTYAPRVNAANDGIADIWEITGTITIPATNTAKIQPSTHNYEGGDLPALFRRLIFKIDGGMTTVNLPTVINTPSTPENPQPTWALYTPPAAPGSTQRIWYLGPQIN